MDMGLKGKHVLITGASGGIGQAAARAFAAEGAAVALHCHTQPDPVTRLCAELGAATVPVHADLRDEVQADAMFAEILRAFPRVDIVVVNAGIWSTQAVPLHQMTVEQWRETLEADLTSAFLTCRAFLYLLMPGQFVLDRLAACGIRVTDVAVEGVQAGLQQR